MDNLKKQLFLAGQKLSNIKNKQIVEDEATINYTKEYESTYDTFLTLKNHLDTFMEPNKLACSRLKKSAYEPPKQTNKSDFVEIKISHWLKNKMPNVPKPLDALYSKLLLSFEELAKLKEQKERQYVERVRREIINNVKIPGDNIKTLTKLIEDKKVELAMLRNSSKSEQKVIDLTQAEYSNLIEEKKLKIEKFNNNHKVYAQIILSFVDIMKTFYKECFEAFDESSEIATSNQENKPISAISEKLQGTNCLENSNAVGSKTQDEFKSIFPNTRFQLYPGVILMVHKKFSSLYTDELSCVEGEILIFIDKVDNNWIECYNFKRFGIIPVSHVSEVNSKDYSRFIMNF